MRTFIALTVLCLITLTLASWETLGCFCPMVVRPVCTLGGKQYSNSCVARCAGEKGTLIPGLCKKRRDDCVCPAVYDPVCSDSGKRYTNKCKARCAGETGYLGPCKSFKELLADALQCICTAEFNPVCTRSGRRYSNPCRARCAHETAPLYPCH
jgi:hypothetical protein